MLQNWTGTNLLYFLLKEFHKYPLLIDNTVENENRCYGWKLCPGKLKTNIWVFLYSRLVSGIGRGNITCLAKLLFLKTEIPRTPRCPEMAGSGNGEQPAST